MRAAQNSEKTADLEALCALRAKPFRYRVAAFRWARLMSLACPRSRRVLVRRFYLVREGLVRP